MEKMFSYVDIGFKLLLAMVAAWSAYIFGYRKQQNDDVKLVTEFMADQHPQKRLVGVALAETYVRDGRIPSGVFTGLLTTMRDASSSARASDDKAEVSAASVQRAAIQALNTVAATNLVVETQLAQANAQLPLHIYFQTANDSDRTRADAFGDRIERLQQTPGIARQVVIPATETKTGYRGPTELRCFKADECRSVAPQLIALLKGHGLSGLADQPTDLSARYERSNRIRPFHFEVWFSAGSVPQ